MGWIFVLFLSVFIPIDSSWSALQFIFWPEVDWKKCYAVKLRKRSVVSAIFCHLHDLGGCLQAKMCSNRNRPKRLFVERFKSYRMTPILINLIKYYPSYSYFIWSASLANSPKSRFSIKFLSIYFFFYKKADGALFNYHVQRLNIKQVIYWRQFNRRLSGWKRNSRKIDLRAIRCFYVPNWIHNFCSQQATRREQCLNIL